MFIKKNLAAIANNKLIANRNILCKKKSSRKENEMLMRTSILQATYFT